MEIPRRVYEPQREQRHKAACASSGRKRQGGRRGEDLIREREHEIQHAAEEHDFRELRRMHNSRTLTPTTT